MIKIAKKLLKKSILYTVVFTFCFSIALLLFYQSKIPQDFIKTLIEYELKKTFDDQITIEKIEGNLFKSVELINVKLENHDNYQAPYFFTIQKLRVNYNLLYLIGRRGRILNSIDGITIQSPTVYLEKSDTRKFNALLLAKEFKPDTKKTPIDYFNGKVGINDLTIVYSDKSGWNKKLKHEAFTETFQQLTGAATVNKHILDFSIIGTINSSKSPIKLSGTYNLKTADYHLNYTFAKVHSNKWGQYLIPLKGFAFLNDTLFIYGDLRNKHTIEEQRLPFWYNVYIQTKNTTVLTPFLNNPFFDTEGVFHIYNATLTENELKSRLSQSKKKYYKAIYQNLIDQSIINKQGLLNKNFNLSNTTKISHLSNDEIYQLFSKPPHNVDFSQIRTRYKFSDIAFNGSLSILRKDIQLQAKLHNVQLESAFKNSLSFTGKATGSAWLKGKLIDPSYGAKLKIKKGSAYAIPVSDVDIDIEGNTKNLSFKLNNAIAYSSKKTNGIGHYTFKGDQSFKASFNTSELVLKSIPELNDLGFQGTANIQSYITYENNGLTLNIISQSQTAIVEKQTINTVNITLATLKDKIKNLTITANINDSEEPLRFQGNEKDNQLELSGEGSNILFTDLSRNETETTKGLITFSSNWMLPDTGHLKTMIENSKVTANIELKNYYFYDQLFDTISLSLNKNDHLFSLNNFKAKSDNQIVDVKGTFENKLPNRLEIKISNLKMKQANWLTQFVPQSLYPFDGEVSLDAHIQKLNSNTTFNKANYSVTSDIKINKAIIKNQAFETVQLKSNWNGQTLTIHKALLMQDSSELALSGQIESSGELKLNLEKNSSIQLEEFNNILARYGHFEGKLNINGEITHTTTETRFDCKFEGRNIAANFTKLDYIKGDILLNNQILTIKNFLLEKQLSKIQVQGVLDGRKGWKIQDLEYDLSLDISQANIHTLNTIFQQLKQDFQTVTIHKEISAEKVPNSNFNYNKQSFRIKSPIDKNNRTLLYSATRENTVSEQFNTIKNQSKTDETGNFIQSIKNLKGLLNGKLSASSRGSSLPYLKGTFKIKDAEVLFLKSDAIELNIEPKNEEIHYAIQFQNGYFGQSKFEEILWTGKVDKNQVLHIDQTKVSTKKAPKANLVTGIIPLKPIIKSNSNNSPIRLNITLKDQQISALSIFHNQIEDIQNKGNIELSITGTIHNPLINAYSFELKETEIQLKNNQIIQIPEGNLSVNNNLISYEPTLIKWGNLKHKQLKINNALISSGTVFVDIKNLLSKNYLNLDLTLHFEKSTLKINNPSTYIGEIKHDNLKLVGSFPIPLSKEAKEKIQDDIKNGNEKGPLLSGTIKFNNGTFALVKTNKSKPIIRLNLDIVLQRDLFINGSLLGEGSFAGLTTDFEIEENKSPLKVSGTLNNPKIENVITFRDGAINIFNNEFILLKPSEQKNYVSLSQLEQLKNQVELKTIQTETKSSVIDPELHLTALAIVEQISEESISSSNLLQASTYSHILVQIDSSINDLSILYFDIYESKYDFINPPDLQWINRYSLSLNADQNQYDESEHYELLSYLMPELTQSNTNSSDVLTKFGEKRVNLLVKRGFLRPLEKQIARSVGLYDLKIDYNLGSELLQSDSNQSNFLGLNLMQQLVADQLFLKVRTNVDLDSNNQDTQDIEISEIELQYYLLKNLSVNYANLKDPFTQNAYRPKLSLRFNHEF